MSTPTTRKSRAFTIFTHLLAGAGALFLLYMGLFYVLDPVGSAAGFGFTSWPTGDDVGMLVIKGGRDLGLGLILVVLLVTRQTRAAGWVLVAMSFMPFFDATTVIVRDGSVATALWVHALTAVTVLVSGLLIVWNETPRKSLPTAA
ncbi:hypothetical protein Afil01_33520 [Actinorhabdospora filicis]|uniref:Small membrane hydrophobic protein n=1 Tax=Actinorhabdospora filicis TaxID=1785913 RepID=A0A9W6WBA8_9ACTN|nr:DUF4267 domain-containing protein [Actinorhabdospora filicis]GLZ78545.1 hypothetical protein Afil01_33520 [Actinorhabdospora filicis]